ncbi:hypothetical protein SeMB42_g03635 [Synchytrium endobioticum]|uniref:Uncharacterized protein n=1 Tax=Synchytrium endobioticum TaxID=286115 RepID=A0A507D5U3_9FUNG|nr:hypothetical protein SeMB42_g03635 [Synchytrium endobioticum]
MGTGASCKQAGTCIAKRAPTVWDRDYNAARNILYCFLVGSTTTLNFSRGFLVVSLFLTGVTADHIREDP